MAAATSGGAASAQWTAVRLQPQGSIGSVANAIWQGQEGGGAASSVNGFEPGLWEGTAASWNRLSAPGGLGIINGMDASEQVGVFGQAALWRGTPQSMISLHPEGVAFSEAYATRGGQQVGYVKITNDPYDYRAALWHGTNAWVNLNPAGAQQSRAQATDGTRQGGWADIPVGSSYVRHATLWSGSAESAIDLNPAPDMGSAILGMCPGQQVGWTKAVFQSDHAAMWSGSAQSWIDLNPIGNPGGSHLTATLGWVQVGFSNVPTANFPHAGIWFGSASSFIDLHQFLPPGYSSSEARAVDFYNGQLEIAGVAVNAQGSYEAFLWRGIPTPGAAVVLMLGAIPLAKRRRR